MWIAWDTESLQWMFLSFPSQETQDALTNSCLVTPHPLSEEVSKKQIQLGCSEKWQEAENQELVCPMSLGAGASIPAVTHLPSRIYAINSTQDQGVDIGNWFGTNEWANDGDQSPQTSQELSHWFLSLLYSFRKYIPQPDSCFLGCPLG